jgi:hypothetical protein
VQSQLHTKRSISELLQLLDEYPAGIDSEFDACFEELESDFAVLRLAPSHSH